MKIINKSDMRFVEGYLVDKDGNVINEPILVDNANTIFEMADFNKFVNANKKRIEEAEGKVEYIIPDVYPVTEVKVSKPKTPTLDAQAAEALKAWGEAESVDKVDEANEMLEEFGCLIDFVESGIWLVQDRGQTPVRFKTDPLDMSIKEIVDAVTEYVDNKELRNKIEVKVQ